MRWLVVALAWVVLGVAIWAALPFSDGDELDGPSLPESTAYDGNVHLTIRSIDPVRFDLARGPRLHAYVYSVLAMPLLLVAALLVFRRRTGGSALEVAAALLAVVTLRQVLVPGDIAGFTVLDKLLGIEVAIITLASIHVQ